MQEGAMGNEPPKEAPPVDYRGHLKRLFVEAAQVASMFGAVVAVVTRGFGVELGRCVLIFALSTWLLKHTPKPPLPGFDE
jgi:hypothetical protein